MKKQKSDNKTINSVFFFESFSAVFHRMGNHCTKMAHLSRGIINYEYLAQFFRLC